MEQQQAGSTQLLKLKSPEAHASQQEKPPQREAFQLESSPQLPQLEKGYTKPGRHRAAKNKGKEKKRDYDLKISFQNQITFISPAAEYNMS